MTVKELVNGPLNAKAKRVLALRPADVRRLREWRHRIKRDTEAMRAIVYRELGAGGSGVDVGAHEGEFVTWFVDAAPDGTHHAVEPLPEFAAHLRARFPGVAVHECALSDTDGTATFFHVIGSPAWSGFHQQEPVAAKETVEIEVAICRLDDLVGDEPVTLVKIDVEGAELGVLRGADKVLDRDRPVLLFEHARVHAASFGTTAHDVWTYLDDLGYSVAPVADESQVLDRVGFVALCEVSHASGYDRRAVTNWIARPR